MSQFTIGESSAMPMLRRIVMGRFPAIARLPCATAHVVRSVSVMLLIFAPIGVDRSEADSEKPEKVSALKSTVEADDIVTTESNASSDGDARVDLYGDPLPAGAIARLGTVRYRHPGWYKKIAFLPDATTFIVGPNENTVRYWDAPSGKMLHEVDLGDDRLNAFRLSPDGKLLATVSQLYNTDPQNRVYLTHLILWDTTSHNEVKRFEWEAQSQGSPVALALSPSGEVAAIGTHNGMVQLRSLRTGEVNLDHKISDDELESIDFSPGGKWIAVAGQRGVKLWKYTSGDEATKLKGLSQGGQVVRFSPDGEVLAVGSSDDAAARLYDVATGDLIRQLRGESERYYREGFCFSAGGKQLIIPAEATHSVEIFDVESGALESSLDCGVIEPRGAAISSDGKFLACIGSKAAILVWNLQTGERISDKFVGHFESPYELQFTPDGRQVVTGSPDASIRVWDATTARQQHLLAHNRWVAGLALSPDGKWIASCGFDDTVRLWDFAAGKEKYRLPGHGNTGSNSTMVVAFSPDSQRFYSFSTDLFLRTYSVQTGRILVEHALRPGGIDIEVTDDGSLQPHGADLIAAMNGFTDQFGVAKFSRDAKELIVSERRKGRIHVFDVASGQEIDTLESESRFLELLFSPRGDLLISVEMNREPRRVGNAGGSSNLTYMLRLRDLRTKEQLKETALEESFASKLAISLDGSLLAVSQTDLNWTPNAKRWIDIFETESMQRVARIGDIASQAHCLRFSPDGTRLAASYSDTTVVIWDLNAFRIEQSRE